MYLFVIRQSFQRYCEACNIDLHFETSPSFIDNNNHKLHWQPFNPSLNTVPQWMDSHPTWSNMSHQVTFGVLGMWKSHKPFKGYWAPIVVEYVKKLLARLFNLTLRRNLNLRKHPFLDQDHERWFHNGYFFFTIAKMISFATAVFSPRSPSLLHEPA